MTDKPDETKDSESVDLQEQIDLLQEQIDGMQSQIDDLGKNQNVSTSSSAGPVESRYLYKDGEAKVFYGAEIKKYKKKGWLKAPAKEKSEG